MSDPIKRDALEGAGGSSSDVPLEPVEPGEGAGSHGDHVGGHGSLAAMGGDGGPFDVKLIDRVDGGGHQPGRDTEGEMAGNVLVGPGDKVASGHHVEVVAVHG